MSVPKKEVSRRRSLLAALASLFALPLLGRRANASSCEAQVAEAERLKEVIERKIWWCRRMSLIKAATPRTPETDLELRIDACAYGHASDILEQILRPDAKPGHWYHPGRDGFGKEYGLSGTF